MFLMAVKINNNNNVWIGKMAHMKTLIFESMKFIWVLIYAGLHWFLEKTLVQIKAVAGYFAISRRDVVYFRKILLEF